MVHRRKMFSFFKFFKLTIFLHQCLDSNVVCLSEANAKSTDNFWIHQDAKNMQIPHKSLYHFQRKFNDYPYTPVEITTSNSIEWNKNPISVIEEAHIDQNFKRSINDNVANAIHKKNDAKAEMFKSHSKQMGSNAFKNYYGPAYDVPVIECPTVDQIERVPCPTPNRKNRYKCIDTKKLCDGFKDCYHGEDEDLKTCMFYKSTKIHIDVLADVILRWTKGKR